MMRLRAVTVILALLAILAAWWLTSDTGFTSFETTTTFDAAAIADAQTVLRLVNIERQKKGAQPLCLNAKLNTASLAHSNDMAARGVLDHTGGDRSEAGQRAARAGYRGSGWAENIAQGYRTAAQVVNGWMTSSGHRRNILDPSYRHMGIARVMGRGGPWWTQMFGSARGEQCITSTTTPAPAKPVAKPVAKAPPAREV